MINFDVYIGWDSRQVVAYDVAEASFKKCAGGTVGATPIKLHELQQSGLYWREVDPLASTEFTYSRFLVPYLNNFQGWALFFDCDFLFFGNPSELNLHMDPDIAVACVQHDYHPKETTKMDGSVQTDYPRKNWSSFMLFNCSHEACKQLTPDVVNSQTGAYLHRMQWCRDEWIGSISEEWNWLEGHSPVPEHDTPKAVHYTRGGPWFEQWAHVPYADHWREYASGVLEPNS